MKCFSLVAAIASITAAEQVTLEDVYGPVPKVAAMNPIWKSTPSRAVKPASFYSARTPENCEFPFEILIVQDLTASFNDNFDAMVAQLPIMAQELGSAHPNTTYGVASFRDKPIAPLGTPATDFCANIDLDFTAEISDVTSIYKPLLRIGGGDPSENQFGALLAASQTNKLTWANNGESTKLVVMVTDAPPHFEGDGSNTMGLKAASGLYNDDTATLDCISEYYPSPDQVLESIKAIEAYFAVLVYDPEYWNGLPAKSWQWFNRFIGQTDDFANLSANDQSDFWTVLKNVITYIENLECVEQPTTTPAPTTVAPTEPATTTAAVTVSPVGSTQQPPAVTEECEETTICEEDVLIKIGFEPAHLNVVVNGRQIANV